MARPRVADRGDGHQIRSVVANILNKQARTAEKGRSGEGLKTPSRKKISCHEMLQQCLGKALANTEMNLHIP